MEEENVDSKAIEQKGTEIETVNGVQESEKENEPRNPKSEAKYAAEVETHHSQEEVVNRLFSVPEVPQQMKSFWGWASTAAKEFEKQFDDTVQKVKSSSEEMLSRIDKVAVDLKSSSDEVFSKIDKVAEDLKHSEFFSTAPLAPKEAEKVVLPWETGNMFSSEIKERILALSKEESSFLVSPPEEVDFKFSEEKKQSLNSLINTLLKTDASLKQMEKEMVPRKLDPLSFWRNYFYRVELITDSYGDISDPKSVEEVSVEEDHPKEEEKPVEEAKDATKSENWEQELTRDVEFDETNTESYEMFDDDELLAGVDVDSEEEDS